MCPDENFSGQNLKLSKIAIEHSPWSRRYLAGLISVSVVTTLCQCHSFMVRTWNALLLQKFFVFPAFAVQLSQLLLPPKGELRRHGQMQSSGKYFACFFNSGICASAIFLQEQTFHHGLLPTASFAALAMLELELLICQMQSQHLLQQ